MRYVVLIAIYAACVAMLVWISGACEDPILTVHAQPLAHNGPDVGLALARLVVNEAGGSELDHEAIHQALRNMGGGDLRVDRGPLRRVLEEADEGRWPRRLDRSMEAPLGWPEDRVPWASEHGVGRWRRILAWADRMVTLERGWPCPCSGVPIAWGGDCSRPGGACDHPGRHLRRVSCGDTRNLFYERVR